MAAEEDLIRSSRIELQDKFYRTTVEPKAYYMIEPHISYDDDTVNTLLSLRRVVDGDERESSTIVPSDDERPQSPESSSGVVTDHSFTWETCVGNPRDSRCSWMTSRESIDEGRPVGAFPSEVEESLKMKRSCVRFPRVGKSPTRPKKSLRNIRIVKVPFVESSETKDDESEESIGDCDTGGTISKIEIEDVDQNVQAKLPKQKVRFQIDSDYETQCQWQKIQRILDNRESGIWTEEREV
ncbi:hypothetical protein ACOME3_004380 [Neoechinorhynchus agilis]